MTTKISSLVLNDFSRPEHVYMHTNSFIAGTMTFKHGTSYRTSDFSINRYLEVSTRSNGVKYTSRYI